MLHGPLTLLIVEAHVGVRTALVQRLQGQPGVDVCAAADVDTAVGVIAARAPDAVLYEPKLTGGDPATGLRRLVQAGRPVVVLTSSLVDGEAETFRYAGAAAVALKGTPLPALLQTIATVLATL